MVGIEIENNLEIAGDDFQAFVRFAIGGNGASPIDGDRAGQKFLGNEDGEGLGAATAPVVDAGEDGVLIIEVVVENDDERGIESEILLEGMSILQLYGHLGDAVGKENMRAVGFVGLRSPFIRDGGAAGLEGEITGDRRGRRTLRSQVGGAFGDPTCTTGVDFEFLVADGIAIEKDFELSFVGNEDGGFFLVRLSQKSSDEEERKES